MPKSEANIGNRGLRPSVAGMWTIWQGVSSNYGVWRAPSPGAPPAAHLPVHGAGIRIHRSRRRHGFLHLLDQRAERKWLGQEGELLVLRQALVEGFFGGNLRRR